MIIRIAPRPAASTAANSSRSGSRSSLTWCAPGRCSDSHGPSRWMPAMTPCSVRSANRATAVSRCSGEAVTTLASVVVVPCSRWKSTPVTALSASYAPPPPPCTCRSTNPGTTIWSPRSTSAGRGGAPDPTALTRPPSITSQPSVSTVSPRDEGAGGQDHAAHRGLSWPRPQHPWAHRPIPLFRAHWVPGRMGVPQACESAAAGTDSSSASSAAGSVLGLPCSIAIPTSTAASSR